jgi:type IX secretion system PorP/SprF family membrane protein
MVERLIILFLGACLMIVSVEGQDVSYGPGYQTVMLKNPAFAGSEGDGILRLSYLNFYPGNNYNLNSFSFSYDTYMPLIHGGAGFFITDDYLGGIINDLRGGFSYAYHFQAGENLYINAGLSASCYYRGFNNRRIILPDQIDPFSGVSVPSGEFINERGRAAFDVGTGIMIMTEKLMAALSVDHLAAPDLSGTGLQSERINRKLTLNLAGEFALDNNLQIVARPVILVEADSKSMGVGAGSSIETKSFSVNAVLLTNTEKNIDLQTGCSIRAGRFLLFYNYRFNIASGMRMLPTSLLHQTGLTLSLNYVDKRKVVKTINFPKL